jgi:hypothetical protein
VILPVVHYCLYQRWANRLFFCHKSSQVIVKNTKVKSSQVMSRKKFFKVKSSQVISQKKNFKVKSSQVSAPIKSSQVKSQVNDLGFCLTPTYVISFYIYTKFISYRTCNIISSLWFYSIELSDVERSIGRDGNRHTFGVLYKKWNLLLKLNHSYSP